MDAVDEMPVDLHIIGPQFRPQPQARITGAQVVQSNRETHRTIMMQRGLQELEVIDGSLFGQFDHDLAGGNAEVLQQLQCAPRLVCRFQQRLGRDVEKQLARQLLLIEALAGAAAAGQLQFAEAAGLACHGKQRDGGVQRAVGGAAGQGFITHDAPFGKADDRLEQAVQTALSQDRTQGTQLFCRGHGNLWR